MKYNYGFFCSSSEHWVTWAKDLASDHNIFPTLWIGDPAHDKKVVELFGDNISVSLPNYRYDADVVGFEELNFQDENFLTSNQYLQVKDICLKMMDRLDESGCFSRLDREIWFHQLSVFGLQLLNNRKIDFLIMTESAHNHFQYLIYELALYKKIPVFKFNVWLPIPVLYLMHVQSKKWIKTDYDWDINLVEKFDSSLQNYLQGIENANKGYNPKHMMLQKSASNGITNQFKRFYSSLIENFKKEVRFTLGTYLYRSANPFNQRPYKIYRLARKRKKNLIESHSSAIANTLPEKFAYFPLHYEPERTTTPDGGEYNDQLKAILSIRAALPSNVQLLIKEHPSTFYPVREGYKGRSPLFYKFLGSLNGIHLIASQTSSIELIKKAEAVFTITGTVAIEAAILGKPAVVLGETWFSELPNITEWKKNQDYGQIISRDIQEPSKIFEQLKVRRDKYAIPAYQNKSNEKRYLEFINEHFLNEQRKSLRYCGDKLIEFIEDDLSSFK